MTLPRQLNWSIISDEHLCWVLEYSKKHYGKYTKMVFTPATLPSLGEERIIYSRAAARFQHLMIIEE